jgi:predicted nucleic acid-binding protein
LVIVDTSVWIDLLRGVFSSRAMRLSEILEDPQQDVALTDVIFMELLRGVTRERQVPELARQLRAFPILRLRGLEDFDRAAELSRAARRTGISLRSSLDLLIATICVRDGLPILHADRDFDRLASCTPLRVFE